jgi:hypothetical protein
LSAIKAWSFSAYDLWYQCPLKYKLEKIDKLKRTDTPALARGREVHDIIAKYLAKERDDLPKTVVKADNARRTYAEFREFDDVIIEKQWGFTSSWKPTGWFAKDTWLRSVIDAGVLYEDMWCEVIDHKTGKKRSGYMDQLELFATTVMCHMPSVQGVTTRLQFVDFDEEPVMEDYPIKDRDKLIAKWNAKVEPMFNDQTFNPRPSDKCRFCDWSKDKGGQCRFG